MSLETIERLKKDFFLLSLFTAIGLGFCNLLSQAVEAREGKELIGKPAQEWTVTHWLNSPPLTLQSLRGKVVLVRWWTAPGCPYCAASAPALNEFHELYREKGLVVIGFYHHKSPQPLNPEEVPRLAKQFGFEFPVAIDPEWRTLRRWWLDVRPRAWTSVSFLIDRKGVIRYIHPGGSYVKGDLDYESLRQKIEELIRETPSGSVEDKSR